MGHRTETKFDTNRIPDYVMHDAVRETLSDSMLIGGTNNRPYQFRCPICGDSKKNKFLRRGYVLYNKGMWVYVCQNECGKMGFLSFLKEYHNAVYKKAIFHAFSKDRSKFTPAIDKRTIAEKTFIPTGEAVFKPGELISIMDNHPKAMQGLQWAMSRQIRKSVYERWFVCLSGEEFLDRDPVGNYVYNENGFPKGNEYKDRIIIPYYRFGGKWSQFDARALNPNALVRYKNLQGVEREPYNIDWLDVTKPFFLLEGSINSTFIQNSVAFGGTKHFLSLLEEHPEIKEYAHNCTVIWDNDAAGYDELSKSIGLGFKWFNWSTIVPSEQFIAKPDGSHRIINDINDLVLYTDITLRDCNEYIDINSIKKYIEEVRGGLIKATLLYGNRDRIRKEKVSKNFEEMKSKRIRKDNIKFNWE